LIAGRLPGRTANYVKNYWQTHLQKKMVSRKLEESKEKEKLEETVNKPHEIIKPQPLTFSANSPWLNRKHSNFVTPIVAVSTKDGTVAKYSDTENTMFPINGTDGNSTMSALWWKNLLNVSNDKIASCSLLQEENFILDFPNVDENDSIWDSNLCDFNSLWDL
jgi:hypothetical protein